MSLAEQTVQSDPMSIEEIIDYSHIRLRKDEVDLEK